MANFSDICFLNLAIDGAFTYGLVYYLQKLGIASLVRLKKINLLLIFTVEALLLYGFQIIKDRLFSQTLLRFK